MAQRMIDGSLRDVGDDWDSLSLDQKGARVDQIGGGSAPPPVGAPPADTAAGIGQALLTAGVRGLGAIADKGLDPLSSIRRLISPKLEEAEYAGSVHPGQMAGDAFFRSTGLREYEPPKDSALGRIAMQGATGGASGSPFGLPGVALGAASGAAAQGARELFQGVLSPDNTARAETVASLLPGGALAARRATNAPQAEVPTAKGLLAEGGEQFKQFRAQPTQVNPSPLSNMVTGLRRSLDDDGFDFDQAPRTTKAWDGLSNPPSAEPGERTYMTPKNLHIAKRRLERIIEDNRGPGGSNDEFVAASATVRELNNFISDLGKNPADIVGGSMADASRTADLFNTANANYAAGKRLDRLTGETKNAFKGVGERAELQADSAYSGTNYDNSVRQQMKAFIQNEKNLAGFTPEEIKTLRGVAAGSLPSNALRLIGNKWFNAFLASGGAGGAIAAGDPTVAAGIALGVPAAGTAIRGLENMLAGRSLGRAEAEIARNSPLYRERAAQLTPRDLTVLQALVPGLLGAP